jgi:DNA-directed RNA polymerase subunit omega
MLYPSIDRLMNKADSKYSLVILASKRARQLLDMQKTELEPSAQKYIGVALEEIADNILMIPSCASRK